MPFDYAGVQADVVSALQEFGVLATFGTGSNNERTGLVLLNKVVKTVYPEALIQTGDFEYLVEAKVNPVAGERLNVAGDKSVIVFVSPIKPADVVLLWYAYGRKG